MSSAADDEAEAPYPSERYAWYVVGVLMLANVSSFVDRQILALLFFLSWRDSRSRHAIRSPRFSFASSRRCWPSHRRVRLALRPDHAWGILRDRDDRGQRLALRTPSARGAHRRRVEGTSIRRLLAAADTSRAEKLHGGSIFSSAFSLGSTAYLIGGGGRSCVSSPVVALAFSARFGRAASSSWLGSGLLIALLISGPGAGAPRPARGKVTPFRSPPHLRPSCGQRAHLRVARLGSRVRPVNYGTPAGSRLHHSHALVEPGRRALHGRRYDLFGVLAWSRAVIADRMLRAGLRCKLRGVIAAIGALLRRFRSTFERQRVVIALLVRSTSSPRSLGPPGRVLGSLPPRCVDSDGRLPVRLTRGLHLRPDRRARVRTTCFATMPRFAIRSFRRFLALTLAVVLLVSGFSSYRQTVALVDRWAPSRQ